MEEQKISSNKTLREYYVEVLQKYHTAEHSSNYQLINELAECMMNSTKYLKKLVKKTQ